jgi:hypothetical protein
MTTPTLLKIVEAIKQALETIDGLRPLATEPDKPNFPTAYPRLADWTHDVTFQEACDELPGVYHFDIWVLVDLNSGMSRAQAELDPFISPVGRKSIKQAIERDERLGGCVSYAIVTGGGSYGTSMIGGLTCLAASMRCEVMT